jgi:hypothetical protein
MDQKIKSVFESVQNLLTAGAVMGVGAAVERYKALITPEYPISSTVASVMIIISGIALSAWALFHGLKQIYIAFEGNQILMYFICANFLFLWGYIVTALLIIAGAYA